MIRKTRPVSWIKAARKEFEKFPATAQTICLRALTIAAEGGKADIAKPFRGMESRVFEVLYAVQFADEIWVLHAFQKKSTQGIKTPQHEIELIRNRLKQLKEMLG